MPVFQVFDASGELVANIAAPDEQVDANVPRGGRFERLAADVDLQSLPVRPPRPRRDDPETAP